MKYSAIPNVGVKADTGPNRTESGVGALMPSADVLWAVTYVSSRGYKSGTGTGLYAIDDRLQIQQRFVANGAYANRLVHKESNQVLIGPYVIDMAGNIRVIKELLDERLAATIRHLADPANRVYVLAMEGAGGSCPGRSAKPWVGDRLTGHCATWCAAACC